MKKSYQRITASLILLSLFLSFLPARARLLAEETGLSSQETEIISYETETLLTSDMSSSETSTSEQSSSRSSSETSTLEQSSSRSSSETSTLEQSSSRSSSETSTSEQSSSRSSSETSTSEQSPSQSSQEMNPLEAADGKAEETTQSQTVAESTSPEFERQAVAQPVETARLSFKVDFKDGGFIASKASRILPELALYRNIAGGKEELLTTDIKDYFRDNTQGNTYAYVSTIEFPLTDTGGNQYTYKIKPIFTADASYYVGDISDISDEKDRYYTLQEEIDITPGVDERLVLTAAADMHFTIHLVGETDRVLPPPVLKNLYQKGLMGKTDNFYENNKDGIALSLESETDSSKTYRIDYLPKFDPKSILGQSSFKYNYGLDLEDPETFRLLKVEPDRDRNLGNLYPNESDFFYTALEAFVFTKIWNDGETNNTRKVVPTFELWQKVGEKTSFVNKVFPDPIYDEENPDRIWKYHFEGLPLVDSKGEAIRYFVKETRVLDGYTASDYNFEENTLINSKAIDLNFSIVWNDNNQVKNRAPKGMDKTPIEILQNGQVYTRDDVLVNPDDPADEKIPSLKTLGKAGENAYRVERIPIADNNLDKYDYTYRVKTEDLPNYNWFVKDEGSDDWRSLTDEELTKGLKESQALRADLKMPVRFTKTWHDASTFKETRPLQEDWLKDVSVYRRIRGKDSKTPFDEVKDVSLNFFTKRNDKEEVIGFQDDSSWYIEAENLPAFDADGNPYEYVFREKSPVSQDKSLGDYETTPAGDMDNIPNGSTSLSRIAQKITVDTIKYWIDDKKPEDRPDVSFYLFRFPENVHRPDEGENAFEILAPVPDYSPVTLDTPKQKLSANEVVLMENVNRYDTYGNEYVYYAYESMTNPDYTNYIDNSGGNVKRIEGMPLNKKGTDYFILNHGSVYNLDFDLIDVSYEKFWNAKSLQQLDGAIQVKLQSKLSTDPDTAWKDVPNKVMTLDGFAAYAMTKEGTFKDLPAYALENFNLKNLDASDTEAVRKYVESFKKENKLQYRVREVAATIDAQDKPVEDYAQVDENNRFEDGGHSFEVAYDDVPLENFTRITNSIRGRLSLEVKKTWEPALPEGTTGEIEVVLLRNDELEWDASEISFSDDGVIRKAASWSKTNPVYIIQVGGDQEALFENFPKYDSTGRLYTYKVRESKHFPADYASNTVNYMPDAVNNKITSIITNFKGKPSNPETTPGEGGSISIPEGSSMPLQFLVEKKWQDDSDLKGRVEITVGLFYQDQKEGSPWLAQTDPQTGKQIIWNLNPENAWIQNVITPELPGGRNYVVREINSEGFTVGARPSEGEFLIDGDKDKTQSYLKTGSYHLGHTDKMKFHIKTDFTNKDGILHFVVTNTRYALEEIPVVKDWYLDAILENEQFKDLLAKANVPADYEPKIENFVAHFELQDVNTTDETPKIYAKYELHAPAKGNHQSSFRFGAIVDETNESGVAKGDVEVVNQFDKIGGYIDYKVVETQLSYVDDQAGIRIDLPFTQRQRAYLDVDHMGNSDFVQNAQKSEQYEAAKSWEDRDKAVLSYSYENSIHGVDRLYLKKVWRDTGTEEQRKLRPDISLKVYRYTDGKPDPSNDERINLAVPQWDATKTNGDSSIWYWKTSFDNMEKYNKEGKPYHYYAVESLVNNTNYRESYYNQGEVLSNPDEMGGSAKAVFPRQFDKDGQDLEAIYPYAEIKPELDKAGIIINTPYSEEKFDGEKIWGLPTKDWFQKSDGFPEVTFKLYRIHNSHIERIIHNPGEKDQYTEILHKETGKPLTIDSPHVEEAFYYEGEKGERISKEAVVTKQGKTDKDYKFTFNRLPAMDDYGETYYYFSREVEFKETGENDKKIYKEAEFNTYIVQADDSTRKISNVYKPDEDQVLTGIDMTKTWKWPEESQRQGQYPAVKFTLSRQTLQANSNAVQLEEKNLAYIVVPGGSINGREDMSYQVTFNRDGSITVKDNQGQETHYTENIDGKVKVFPDLLYYYSQTDKPYVYKVSESILVPSGGSQNAYITTDANAQVKEGDKPLAVSEIKADFKLSEDEKLANGQIGFTNTFNEQKKPVQAKKTWEDFGYSDLRPENPDQAFKSFVLKRKTNGNTDETFKPVDAKLTAEVVVIAEDVLAKELKENPQAYAGKWTKPSETSNTWTYHFPGNYPTYDTEGNLYVYYAVETLKEPYDSSYQLSSSRPTSPSNTSTYGTATLINNLETVSPKLEKDWYLKEDSEKTAERIPIKEPQVLKYLQKLGGLPEELTFKLEGKKGNSPWEVVKTLGDKPEPITKKVNYSKLLNKEMTFTDLKLPKYYYDEDETESLKAEEMKYRLVEDLPEEYKAGMDAEGDLVEGSTIKSKWENTLTTIRLNLIKNWDDQSNRDGKRPESILVNIVAKDPKKENRTFTLEKMPIQIDDSYQSRGEDDPYAPNVNRWAYTLKVPAGFEYSVEEVKDENSAYTLVTEESKQEKKDNQIYQSLTNAYTPLTFSIRAVKNWKYDDFYLGGRLSRPESLDLYLEYKNRNGEWVNLSDLEKAPADNEGVPVGKDARKTIRWDEDNADSSVAEFKNLPAYLSRSKGEDGQLESLEEAYYRVREVPIKGYLLVSSKEAISYSNRDNETGIANLELTNYLTDRIDVRGTKIWQDADNQDGLRPETITVSLLAQTEEMEEPVEVETKEITMDDSGNWRFAFNDLPLRSASGKLITYTLKEDKVPGYDTEIDQLNYKITNTHIPEELAIPVRKVWNDGEDVARKRPQDITVELLADDEVVDRLILSEANDWQGSFSDLPKFSEGKEIAYAIEEVAVDGYETRIEGSVEKGFVIHNFYRPQTTTETTVPSDTTKSTSSETTVTEPTETKPTGPSDTTKSTSSEMTVTEPNASTSSSNLTGPSSSETNETGKDVTGTGIREKGVILGSVLLITMAVFVALKRKMEQDEMN